MSRPNPNPRPSGPRPSRVERRVQRALQHPVGAQHPLGARANRRPAEVRFRILLGAAAFLLLGFAACSGDRGEERVPLDAPPPSAEPVADLPPDVQVQLDSANAAYRSGAYDQALEHFRAATRLAPDLAAGWYGVGMTQSALGNQAAADSAMMHVHRLAPDVPLQHPSGDAPPNPHPAIPPGAEEDGGY